MPVTRPLFASLAAAVFATVPLAAPADGPSTDPAATMEGILARMGLSPIN